MSSWVVAALILNAVLVAVAIVFAVRIASRSAVVAVEVQFSQEAVSAVTLDADADPRPPLFDAAQMTRTEWRALLDAFDAARVVYVRELIRARSGQPLVAGSLTRATHDFEVAKRRLIRFELEVSSGSRNGRR